MFILSALEIAFTRIYLEKIVVFFFFKETHKSIHCIMVWKKKKLQWIFIKSKETALASTFNG